MAVFWFCLSSLSDPECMAIFCVVCIPQNYCNINRSGSTGKIIKVGAVLFVIRVEGARYSGREIQLWKLAMAAWR